MTASQKLNIIFWFCKKQFVVNILSFHIKAIVNLKKKAWTPYSLNCIIFQSCIAKYTTQHSFISNPFGFEKFFEHEFLSFKTPQCLFRILHFCQPCNTYDYKTVHLVQQFF